MLGEFRPSSESPTAFRSKLLGESAPRIVDHGVQDRDLSVEPNPNHQPPG
jgi:hypothetical protein